ncbi:hypothetical protein I6U48_14225 [Clostridium sp. PL3]|uniref:YCII-related domain-containing protein n=1 Tax=Clostridium thailandense TaxID=2794346 RepID=A0A949TYQ4_9CLOT|nr:hypothetical protein [Clostridium thailandense]MBV7274060.1 hypothetical protein [Clostridium thailandense]
MNEYNLFIRINYKTSENDRAVSGNTRVNNGSVNSSKYLIGGGILNRKGGTVIFSAKNLEEVKQITEDRALLKDISMNYNVAVIPKGI